MRPLLLCFLVAACAPEVTPGVYLCGPDSACPEDQACDGVDDTCVLSGMAQPFSCTPKFNFEPDDAIDQGHEIADLGCVSAAYTDDNCMLPEDPADWLTFRAPDGCTAVEVQARLTFPIAYAALGLELWNVDTDMKLAIDGECTQGAADGAQVRRCLDAELASGTAYAIKVLPTGAGDCDGDCAYNRYTVSVQLATPD